MLSFHEGVYMAIAQTVLGALLLFISLRMVWKESRLYERGLLPTLLGGFGGMFAVDGISKLFGWG
jgi:hypothetical protein